MEKERDRRYSTAGALAEDAERYLRQEPIEAGPPTTRYVLRKFVARHRYILAALAAITGALILGLIGTTSGLLQARTQRNNALAAGMLADQSRQAAEDISQCLQDMLASANPEVTRGRTVTVLEVLDNAAAKLDTPSMAKQPQTEGVLRQTLGKTYLSLGQYSKAVMHLRRAVAIYRELPDSQFQLASSLTDLGNALKEEADYGDAERVYDDALEVSRKIAPGDHTLIANGLNNLGNAYLGKQDLARAEALFQESIKASRLNGGDDRLAVSTAWMNLGCVRLQAKDFEGAAAFFQQALDLQRKLGNDDPQLILRLVDLSIALQQSDRPDQADRALAEAMDRAHQIYGLRHPMVARVLDPMAYQLLRKEDLSGAATLIEQALEMTRGLESESDPFMLDRLQKLAKIYDKTGDEQKSKAIFWEWMAAQSGALTQSIKAGRDDYATRFERGCLLVRMGKLPEALDDMEAAVGQKARAFSPRYYAALLALAQGDVNGYRAQCGMMMEQFGATSDPRIAAQMAVATLQAPQEGLAVSTISGWIDPASEVSDQDDVVNAQKFARALLLYRTASWNNAADAFAAVGRSARSDVMHATADVYLGMIRLQQNSSDENVAALHRTIADWDAKLPQAGKQDLGESFDEWLFWRISVDQAREALGEIP
jgi:tetratricopeptide (TPR) repeat protein